MIQTHTHCEQPDKITNMPVRLLEQINRSAPPFPWPFPNSENKSNAVALLVFLPHAAVSIGFKVVTSSSSASMLICRAWVEEERLPAGGCPRILSSDEYNIMQSGIAIRISTPEKNIYSAAKDGGESR